LLDDLPKIYAGLTDEVRKLKPAVDYYKNFVANPEMDLLPTLSVHFHPPPLTSLLRLPFQSLCSPSKAIFM
jgi:hypothetical protein